MVIESEELHVVYLSVFDQLCLITFRNDISLSLLEMKIAEDFSSTAFYQNHTSNRA